MLLSATFPTFYERQIVIDSIQLNLVCGLYPTFFDGFAWLFDPSYD